MSVTFLLDGLSEREFHGNLVYKFKNIVGRTDYILINFRKIVMDCKSIIYKSILYNLNVMPLSACLDFNPVMVIHYASLFHRTPMSLVSDCMVAPLQNINFSFRATGDSLASDF